MSDEKRWTPGPWWVYGSAVAHVTSAHGAVANCGDWKDVRREDEQLPNAYLIAASPDLYEALNCWALRKLLGMVEDSGDDEMWVQAKWFMEIRDHALAKARGENSDE